MDIRDLSKVLRERGHLKHATLLEHALGEEHVRALTHPQWRASVTAAFGEDVYAMLLTYREERGLDPVADFSPRTVSAQPITVHVDHVFGKEDLLKAKRAAEVLGENETVAEKTLYKIVRTLDDATLLRIFRDQSAMLDPHDLERQTPKYHRRKSKYRHFISERAKQLSVWKEERHKRGQDFPPYVFSVKRMIDVLPLYPGEDPITYPEALVEHADALLQDLGSFERSFEAWAEREVAGKEAHVIADSKDRIASVFDPQMSPREHPLSPEGIRYHLSDDYGNFEGSADILDDLMHAAPRVKEAVLKGYDHDMNLFARKLTGLEQILNGGVAVNPNADPISITQNDGLYPNIVYPQSVRKKIRRLAREMRAVFNDLPDINDLATTSKMRKRRDLTYTVREMEKNPLDVTFGNESGCCVFVPDKVEDMQNGFSIPYFLTNPGVRLFEVVRSDGDRDRRMGFALAFDAQDENGNSILAVNSLELSRLGINGGHRTIRAIVEYAEQAFATYAAEHGYAGATMGAHHYNTSENYSQARGALVRGSLTFPSADPFYSDIFTDSRTTFKVAPPESSYWISGQK